MPKYNVNGYIIEVAEDQVAQLMEKYPNATLAATAPKVDDNAFKSDIYSYTSEQVVGDDDENRDRIREKYSQYGFRVKDNDWMSDKLVISHPDATEDFVIETDRFFYTNEGVQSDTDDFNTFINTYATNPHSQPTGAVAGDIELGNSIWDVSEENTVENLKHTFSNQIHSGNLSIEQYSEGSNEIKIVNNKGVVTYIDLGNATSEQEVAEDINYAITATIADETLSDIAVKSGMDAESIEEFSLYKVDEGDNQIWSYGQASDETLVNMLGGTNEADPEGNQSGLYSDWMDDIITDNVDLTERSTTNEEKLHYVERARTILALEIGKNTNLSENQWEQLGKDEELKKKILSRTYRQLLKEGLITSMESFKDLAGGKHGVAGLFDLTRKEFQKEERRKGYAEKPIDFGITDQFVENRAADFKTDLSVPLQAKMELVNQRGKLETDYARLLQSYNNESGSTERAGIEKQMRAVSSDIDNVDLLIKDLPNKYAADIGMFDFMEDEAALTSRYIKEGNSEELAEKLAAQDIEARTDFLEAVELTSAGENNPLTQRDGLTLTLKHLYKEESKILASNEKITVDLSKLVDGEEISGIGIDQQPGGVFERQLYWELANRGYLRDLDKVPVGVLLDLGYTADDFDSRFFDMLSDDINPYDIPKIKAGFSDLEKIKKQIYVGENMIFLNIGAEGIEKDSFLPLLGKSTAGAINKWLWDSNEDLTQRSAEFGAFEYTPRAMLDTQQELQAIHNEYNEEAISTGEVKELSFSEKGEAKFERRTYESVAEGVGEFVPLIIQMAVANKAAGAIGITKWFDTIGKAKGVYNKLGYYSAYIGYEEAKMQALGFKTTSGAAFGVGHLTTNWMKLGGKWGKLLDPIFQTFVKSPLIGATSLEFAQNTEALWDDAFVGGVDFETHWNEMYGDVDEITARGLVNFLTFFATNVPQAKGSMVKDPYVFYKKYKGDFDHAAKDLNKKANDIYQSKLGEGEVIIKNEGDFVASGKKGVTENEYHERFTEKEMDKVSEYIDLSMRLKNMRLEMESKNETFNPNIDNKKFDAEKTKSFIKKSVQDQMKDSEGNPIGEVDIKFFESTDAFVKAGGMKGAAAMYITLEGRTELLINRVTSKGIEKLVHEIGHLVTVDILNQNPELYEVFNEDLRNLFTKELDLGTNPFELRDSETGELMKFEEWAERSNNQPENVQNGSKEKREQWKVKELLAYTLEHLSKSPSKFKQFKALSGVRDLIYNVHSKLRGTKLEDANLNIRTVKDLLYVLGDLAGGMQSGSARKVKKAVATLRELHNTSFSEINNATQVVSEKTVKAEIEKEGKAPDTETISKENPSVGEKLESLDLKSEEYKNGPIREGVILLKTLTAKKYPFEIDGDHVYYGVANHSDLKFLPGKSMRLRPAEWEKEFKYHEGMEIASTSTKNNKVLLRDGKILEGSKFGYGLYDIYKTSLTSSKWLDKADKNKSDKDIVGDLSGKMLDARIRELGDQAAALRGGESLESKNIQWEGKMPENISSKEELRKWKMSASMSFMGEMKNLAMGDPRRTEITQELKTIHSNLEEIQSKGKAIEEGRSVPSKTVSKAAIKVAESNRELVKELEAIPNVEAVQNSRNRIFHLNRAIDKARKSSVNNERGDVTADGLARIEKRNKKEITKLMTEAPDGTPISNATHIKHKKIIDALVMDNLGLAKTIANEAMRRSNVDSRIKIDPYSGLQEALIQLAYSFRSNKPTRNAEGELNVDKQGNPIHMEFGAYVSKYLPERLKAVYEAENVGMETGVTHKDVGEMKGLGASKSDLSIEEIAIMEKADAVKLQQEKAVNNMKLKIIRDFNVPKEMVEPLMERITNYGVELTEGIITKWSDLDYGSTVGLGKEITEWIMYNPKYINRVKEIRKIEKEKGITTELSVPNDKGGFKRVPNPKAVSAQGGKENVYGLFWILDNFKSFKTVLSKTNVSSITGYEISMSTNLRKIMYEKTSSTVKASETTARRSAATGKLVGATKGGNIYTLRDITREEFMEAINAKEGDKYPDLTGVSPTNIVAMNGIISKNRKKGGFYEQLERAITNQLIREAIELKLVSPELEFKYSAERLGEYIGKDKGENLWSLDTERERAREEDIHYAESKIVDHLVSGGHDYLFKNLDYYIDNVNSHHELKRYITTLKEAGISTPKIKALLRRGAAVKGLRESIKEDAIKIGAEAQPLSKAFNKINGTSITTKSGSYVVDLKGPGVVINKNKKIPNTAPKDKVRVEGALRNERAVDMEAAILEYEGSERLATYFPLKYSRTTTMLREVLLGVSYHTGEYGSGAFVNAATGRALNYKSSAKYGDHAPHFSKYAGKNKNSKLNSFTKLSPFKTYEGYLNTMLEVSASPAARKKASTLWAQESIKRVNFAKDVIATWRDFIHEAPTSEREFHGNVAIVMKAIRNASLSSSPYSFRALSPLVATTKGKKGPTMIEHFTEMTIFGERVVDFLMQKSYSPKDLDNIVGDMFSGRIEKVVEANIASNVGAVANIGTNKLIFSGGGYLQKIRFFNGNAVPKELLRKQKDIGYSMMKDITLLTKKAEMYSKATGTKSSGETLASIHIKINNLDKATRLGRVKKKDIKGASIWDFDDTLATSKSGVRYRDYEVDGSPQPGRKMILAVDGGGKNPIADLLKLEKQGFVSETLVTNKKGGEGTYIDATGKELENVLDIKREYEEAGYDVALVSVETSKGEAAINNATKDGSLNTKDATAQWDLEQANRSKFIEVFGENYFEINSEKIGNKKDLPLSFTEQVQKFTHGYKRGRLNAEGWAEKGEDFGKRGVELDFSEFEKVVDGKPGVFFEKARARIEKFGAEHTYILTARPPGSQGPIREFLKAHGIDIPLENITGLGKSEADAKADWIIEKFAEGYNDMYFADDAIQNIKAVAHVLNQLDIKAEVQQAVKETLHSNEDLVDGMIDRRYGVDAEVVFDDASGGARGKRVKDFFKGYGYEDFNGLVYPLLGKGKQGEKDKKNIEELIVDPYMRGTQEWHSANRVIYDERVALRRQKPEMHKRLTDVPTDSMFAWSDLIRVYMWERAGHDVPGLEKGHKEKILDTVIKDTEMLMYAEDLLQIARLEGGWAEPSKDWAGQSIDSDFFEITNGKDGRKKYLSEFIENLDTIFHKEALNKAESVLGSKWRVNMNDSIARMKSGSGRGESLGPEMNWVMNFLNGSSKMTMFLNQRSALTQSISMINFADMGANNPIAIGKTMANPKQFIKDFLFVFNSDYLTERRGGAMLDLASSEINKLARTGGDGSVISALQSHVAKLLNLGYLPTRIMDSFAISTGGASYYRNYYNKYVKEGMDATQAHEKAWLEFSKKTEPLQQSSDQMFMSRQQTSLGGRVFLGFKNTPMQMFRQHKRYLQDIKHNRGSKIGNVLGAAYYGPLQIALFYAIQTALWGQMFDDDEGDATDEDRDAKLLKDQTVQARVANGVIDSYIQGMGIWGTVVVGGKNTILEWRKQAEKGYKGDPSKILLQGLNTSPIVGIKSRMLVSAFNNLKYNEGVSDKIDGFNINDPSLMSYANLFGVITNVPMHRVLQKARNVEEALDEENQNWQRFGHLNGFSRWDMGTTSEYIDAIKVEVAEDNKAAGIEKRKVTTKRKREEEEAIIENLTDGMNAKEKKDFIESRKVEKEYGTLPSNWKSLSVRDKRVWKDEQYVIKKHGGLPTGYSGWSVREKKQWKKENL